MDDFSYISPAQCKFNGRFERGCMSCIKMYVCVPRADRYPHPHAISLLRALVEPWPWLARLLSESTYAHVTFEVNVKLLI